jgi:SAM-dependent methyltransferase
VSTSPIEPIATISPQDEMYAGHRDHYFGVGQSALACIQHALDTAGAPPPQSILDLPCGHGRVMRFLHAAFPSARLTACDLLRDGVDFCAEQFGAEPVYSTEDPREIELDGPFDLIWCGSLLTHLDERGWRDFFHLFGSLLAPEGVMVVTTSGRFVIELLKVHVRGADAALPQSSQEYYERRAREYFADIPDDEAARMLEQCETTGFGYADYARTPGYGVSVAKPSWVCALAETVPGASILTCLEQGWDNTQDVFSCVRRERLPATPLG